MKKLFYRLPSNWSFAKLFSVMVCIALGSLFAQQADAQDFFFGWEPFPPSSWDGGWDASLKCVAIDGTTTLTRGSTDSVVQNGTVSCTFTDTGRTPTFQETATCSLHIEIDNLSESCANNGTSPPTSTLKVTGICPVATVQAGQGTIDCTGAPFCSYAGNDPDGNTSGQCVWNLGFGALKGQKVVPLTQTQCQTAFGSSREVFSFSQTFEGSVCAPSAQIVKMGDTSNKFCHSDTWDPSQRAICAFPKGTVKNTASGTIENFLTADTEYSPTKINTDCSGNKDHGDITLLVFGNNSDPNTNAIAVQAINLATVTVNDFKAERCDFPNPDTLRCRVPSCVANNSIIAPGTNTLQMEAFMSDGTHVVGDLEVVKTSP